MNEFIENATYYGIRTVGALVLFGLVWMIAGWISGMLRKSLLKANFDKTLTQFMGNALRWLIILMGILACLSLFGIQTTSFAAVLGAAGVAIGLAFQGSLSNLAAGMMLLIFRPFKVDDYVVIDGEEGTVRGITLFTTNLDTLDNRRICVPNSQVFGNVIQILTHNPVRRVDIDVGVDYGADMDQTRSVLMEAAKAIPHQAEGHPPEIFLKGLGGSSVDWQVRVWADPKDYWVVWDATVRAAKAGLDQAGITIPFPQMDVHVDGGLDK